MVYEPFHFRGRRGLGSEAIRHARGREQRAKRHRNGRRARQTGAAEVDCCSRPIRHGLRSYGRGLLLSLGTLTSRGTTCVDANGESPGDMSADSPQAGACDISGCVSPLQALAHQSLSAGASPYLFRKDGPGGDFVASSVNCMGADLAEQSGNCWLKAPSDRSLHVVASSVRAPVSCHTDIQLAPLSGFLQPTGRVSWPHTQSHCSFQARSLTGSCC